MHTHKYMSAHTWVCTRTHMGTRMHTQKRMHAYNPLTCALWALEPSETASSPQSLLRTCSETAFTRSQRCHQRPLGCHTGLCTFSSQNLRTGEIQSHMGSWIPQCLPCLRGIEHLADSVTAVRSRVINSEGN